MPYGISGWGGGAWGNGAESSPIRDVIIDETLAITDAIIRTVPLRVTQAVPPSPFTVKVTFSDELNISYPPLIDPANYTIPGLTVTGVVVVSNTQVLLTTTPAQTNILYTVTVAQAESAMGDLLGPDNSAIFLGFSVSPSFVAGAESPTKIELVFSNTMLVNGAFTNPANYTLTRVTGSVPITILSVTPSGPTPIRRATLLIDTPLISKEYYAIVVSDNVRTILDLSLDPDTEIFQWADLTRPRNGLPLEIPIKDFSGEVTGGILGDPDGQVFFTPAYDTVTADSTIELEELSVCTRAYDEYHFPNPPDPPPLFTFSPGRNSGLVGPTNVLWAPAPRLGQAKLNLRDRHDDVFNPPIYNNVSGMLESPIADTPATAVLEEPIDITKASFLNDPRWILGGSLEASSSGAGSAMLENTVSVAESVTVERFAPGFTVTWTVPVPKLFTTAANLSSIGPGPTQNLKLSRNPRLDVRDVTDNLSIDDVAYPDTDLVDLATDSMAVSDSSQVSPTWGRDPFDAVALTDTVTAVLL